MDFDLDEITLDDPVADNAETLEAASTWPCVISIVATVTLIRNCHFTFITGDDDDPPRDPAPDDEPEDTEDSDGDEDGGGTKEGGRRGPRLF
jgi:hypothetical protein